jgi:leucyl aminopeptidase (aminopeptidase T)
MRMAIVKNVDGKPHKVEENKLYVNTKHGMADVMFNALKLDGWEEVTELSKNQQEFLKKSIR